jgi:hypothetical protein
MCLGTPDVCKTPPLEIPVPYVNIAQLAICTNVVVHVLVKMRPAVVQGSSIPISSGDEAGATGGVISAMFIGPAQPRTQSSKVYFGGRKAVYSGCTWGMNGTNANVPMGMQVAPSQTAVVVAP